MFRDFMRDMLRGQKPAAELLEKGQNLGLSLVSSCYEMVIFHFDIADGESERLHMGCVRLLQDMEISLYYFHVFDGLVLVLTGNDRVQLKEEAYRINMIFRHELMELSPFITVIIGRVFSRFSQISQQFLSAESLMKKIWQSSSGRVVDMDDAADMVAGLTRPA